MNDVFDGRDLEKISIAFAIRSLDLSVRLILLDLLPRGGVVWRSVTAYGVCLLLKELGFALLNPTYGLLKVSAVDEVEQRMYPRLEEGGWSYSRRGSGSELQGQCRRSGWRKGG